MKPVVSSLIALLIVTGPVTAREWVDKEGRSVEAKVVRVYPDRTVMLRTPRGKTVVVPFDTFSDWDIKHLESLLPRTGRSKLHPVAWYSMNDLFGIELWEDDLLFDDSAEAVAKRMNMNRESKTDFMENYRAYPLGKSKILGEQVYTTALYSGTESIESLSLVFRNRGDLPNSGSHLSITEQIETSGMHVRDNLAQVLGEPKRDSLGKGDTREKVWRWDWNDHAIMLSLQEGKYAAVRIMPSERADRGGRLEKLTENGLKKRMASCVERRENGDVVIRNIPMVNQGPKGYCSPATWERYLRYMGIPADMYLLALAAGTGTGGSTSSSKMIQATKTIVAANGRELEYIDISLKPANVAEYIDQGLPIMWRFTSTPAFQWAAYNNTLVRNGKEPKMKNGSGQAEDTGSGGHICLVIGYNRQTDEIAISDSWGPRFAERWVKTEDIRGASHAYDSMNVILW